MVEEQSEQHKLLPNRIQEQASARFFLQIVHKTERLTRRFPIVVTASFPFASQLEDIPSFVLIILPLHYLL
jgi:hypothetical protein